METRLFLLFCLGHSLFVTHIYLSLPLLQWQSLLAYHWLTSQPPPPLFSLSPPFVTHLSSFPATATVAVTPCSLSLASLSASYRLLLFSPSLPICDSPLSLPALLQAFPWGPCRPLIFSTPYRCQHSQQPLTLKEWLLSPFLHQPPPFCHPQPGTVATS